MSIIFDEKTQQFHLRTVHTSYVMDVLPGGWLRHLYWGARIERFDGARTIPPMDRSFAANPVCGNRDFSLDTTAQEYPSYGHTDFREPAIAIALADGSRITDFRYVGYEITQEKRGLLGLPAVYAGDSAAESLDITLRDETAGLDAILTYSLLADSDAIMRSVRIVNRSQSSVKITHAMSASVDLAGLADWEALHLPGAHARERIVERRPLGHYRHVVESRRGASSHQEQPFLALLAPGADETHGGIYAMSLIYSGSFQAFAEPDQFDVTRMAIGLNPFDFSWQLAPGASFQTPEAVLVYSGSGLGTMSRTFHHLWRKHLCRGTWRDRVRPVLVNNWEATFFDFDERKLFALIDQAKALRLELMVLDDGWFGHRDADDSSLGDWFVDKRKLPHGLQPVAEHAVEQGLMFGLWFEPEMISRDSELFAQHPDWALGVPGREASEGRGQLVLDLVREDVQSYIVESVSRVLRSAPIGYVKWDMNRHMTDVYSAALPPERQQETMHRYMLGLYAVLEELCRRFPDVLFESCSGGGGRFDPGMLYYMPQTWTSDDLDAIERLAIQYGTSLLYPGITMGAHVSVNPSNQAGRSVPLATRGLVAMQGAFGYELDITQFTNAESAEVRAQVALFKELRPLLQQGALYRVLVPTHHGAPSAWMVVAEDRRTAFLTYVQPLAQPNPAPRFLHLAGLAPDVRYQIDCVAASADGHFPGVPQSWSEKGPDGRVFGGDELMRAGIRLPMLFGDSQSFGWLLRATEEETSWQK